MTSYKHITPFVLLGAMGAVPQALAQQSVAFDDFDGNGNFISRVFSIDNNSTNGVFNGGDASRFDRFGIVNRDTTDTNPGGPGNLPLALPFDAVDDSNNGFAADNIGVLKTTDIGNNVVLLADSNNPFTASTNGVVQIDWDFDISGYENLQISVDFAAVGNFEDGSDVFAFNTTLDGDSGTFQTPFLSSVAEDTFYTVTMEGGQTFGRFTNPFFGDEASGNAPDDNPVVLDIDGDPEFLDYVDPVLINGVQLNNNFQTITADITGTGEVLNLNFQGLADASLEYFFFDNILITGDLIGPGLLLGDLNLDGEISALDIQPFVDALADPTQFQLSNELTLADFLAVSDINADGDLTALDIQPFVDLLSGSSVSSSQITSFVALVPEPTTAGLLGLGLLGIVRCRRCRGVR